MLRPIMRHITLTAGKVVRTIVRKPLVSAAVLLLGLAQFGVGHFWQDGWRGAGNALTIALGGGIEHTRRVGSEAIASFHNCRFDYRFTCIDNRDIVRSAASGAIVPVPALSGCYARRGDPISGLPRQDFQSPQALEKGWTTRRAATPALPLRDLLQPQPGRLSGLRPGPQTPQPPATYACLPAWGAPWALLGGTWDSAAPFSSWCRYGTVGMLACSGYWGLESLLGVPQAVFGALWTIGFTDIAALVVTSLLVISYAALIGMILAAGGFEGVGLFALLIPAAIVAGLAGYFYAFFGLFDLLVHGWGLATAGIAWISSLWLVQAAAAGVKYAFAAGGAIASFSGSVDKADKWKKRLSRWTSSKTPPSTSA